MALGFVNLYTLSPGTNLIVCRYFVVCVRDENGVLEWGKLLSHASKFVGKSYKL